MRSCWASARREQLVRWGKMERRPREMHRGSRADISSRTDAADAASATANVLRNVSICLQNRLSFSRSTACTAGTAWRHVRSERWRGDKIIFYGQTIPKGWMNKQKYSPVRMILRTGLYFFTLLCFSPDNSLPGRNYTKVINHSTVAGS